MSGYPGFAGNQGAMGGQDVEMGGMGAGGSDPRMMGGMTGMAPTAAFMTQAAANPTQGGTYSGYGQMPPQQPPPPQSYGGGPSKPYNPYGAQGQGQASGYGGGKPTYHQPQYTGYGQTQAGGGYAAPPIQQPPPPPPPPSQYIQDVSQLPRPPAQTKPRRVKLATY